MTPKSPREILENTSNNKYKAANRVYHNTSNSKNKSRRLIFVLSHLKDLIAIYLNMPKLKVALIIDLNYLLKQRKIVIKRSKFMNCKKSMKNWLVKFQRKNRALKNARIIIVKYYGILSK